MTMNNVRQHVLKQNELDVSHSLTMKILPDLNNIPCTVESLHYLLTSENTAPMPRHSKLQLQVLALYKNFLRVSADKPGVRHHIQTEFRKWSSLQRTDVLRIEHLIRRGQRQLTMLQTGEVQRAGTFSSEPKSKQNLSKQTEDNVT